MSSREDILQSIRRATHVKYEKPDLKPLEEHALTYPNVVEQFYFMMKQVGGEAVFLEEGQDINKLIRESFNPDNVEDPAELDGTDLAIIDGKIGVAENGAVWIEQDVKQRALYFISEKLVILLDKGRIVNNMHEAYKRIHTGEYGFGTYISGPSKTADIEQALVMGAHGARDVMVIIK